MRVRRKEKKERKQMRKRERRTFSGTLSKQVSEPTKIGFWSEKFGSKIDQKLT